MPRRKDRIIIDTNIWISFLLTKDFSRLDKIFKNGNVVLLFSEELLKEFIEVSGRTKFKRYFTPTILQELLMQIRGRGEFIIVKSYTAICRDPKDNFLLSLSKDGKASHLITGDKDLLDLKRFGKAQITTLQKYLAGR